MERRVEGLTELNEFHVDGGGGALRPVFYRFTHHVAVGFAGLADEDFVSQCGARDVLGNVVLHGRPGGNVYFLTLAPEK